MPRFKSKAPYPVDLFAQAGEVDSFRVKPGEEVEIPGDVTNADDAESVGYYAVGEGAEARVWSTAAWELVPDGGSKRSGSRTPAAAKPEGE